MYQMTNLHVNVLSRHGINLHFKLGVENNLPQAFQVKKKKTCERRLSDELTLALTIKILMTKLLPTAVQAACHGTTMFPNAQEPTTVSLSGREYAEKFKLWNSGFGGYGNMMVQKIPQTLV